MSLPRIITIDTYDRREQGAYGLIVEYAGQAPILMETEGCASSFKDTAARIEKWQGKPLRWCIVRLVPVEGNELLLLDFERLQQFNKEPKE
jgi:hypothetical protein